MKNKKFNSKGNFPLELSLEVKHMKNIIKIITFTFILILFSGCNQNNQIVNLENKEDILLGVVETTSQEYKSYIHWFNEDLELVEKQELEYAMLGSHFYNPVYEEDQVMLIPAGLGNKKDTKKVIGINTSDFSIEEYPFNNIALNDITARGSKIYAVNTLNGDTHLSSYNKEDESSKEIIIENEYICGITDIDGEIYAFSATMEDITPEFTLYIYNEELNLIDEIDISDYGTTQLKSLVDGDYFYTSVMSTKDDLPGTTLMKISTKTHEIEEIDIGEEFPNDIYNYEDQLIITNYDPVTNEGTKITVLDKNSYEKQVIDLGESLTLTEIYHNHLFVANEETIKVFDIDKDFDLINEIELEKDEDTYISAILLMK